MGGESETSADSELMAGRYEVLATLGSGGMATVYKVRDQRTDRHLALKRMRSEKGAISRAATHLFAREFYTLSELSHPRIIEVYDYGVDGNDPYYTMELLDGSDLREGGQLPWRDATRLLCDVASSLAILHSRKLVHRDVSPRNVRKTSDGRAKLFDFGAMVPMGVPKEVVGTAPCVPPESLQHLAVDGRADLYSLGALGYWMLTGRYPYAARAFEHLPEAWKHQVHAPHELVSEIPEPLSRVVMQLLSLDRAGRPGNAAEVIERLSAIAGFEPDRPDAVTLAYLTSPVLVGREALIADVRRAIAASAGGIGSTLVISGAAGSGRTRALDACVLEARVSGAIVLRADASDSSTGDYGAARALVRQLLEALPHAGEKLEALHRPEVASVIPELGEPGVDPVAPERRRVQAALREWVLGLARDARLFIAVDNVDHLDEPSAALLAAIAHRAARRSIVVAATRESGSAETLALQILEQHGTGIDLAPLNEQETETLIRSVFGEVDQVVAVARRIHEASGGNPRDALDLAQHLVQRGRARYEAGGWVLPADLAESDLPRSVGAALETLDPDARGLAEALSLTDPEWLSLAEYPRLTDHTSEARVFRALSVLVSSNLLVIEGDRYRFTRRAVQSGLEAQLSEARKLALHGRLAAVAEQRKDPIRLLYHLLHGGQEERAIDELLSRIGTDSLEYSPATLELLERARSAAERLDLPRSARLALELRIVGVSSLLGEYAIFSRYASSVRERLIRDSGLADWAELGDEIAAPERLQRALALAHERHQTAPERERGFPPFDSIKRLARLYAGFAAMAGTAQDRELLANLPSLMPFSPLSPAVLVIQQVVEGERALEEGRFERTRELFKAVLERIAEPDGAGLEQAYRDQTHYSLTFIIAALDTRSGMASALDWCSELERVPRHRVNAWRARKAHYRIQGEIAQAKRCQRFIELLQLEDGVQPFQNVGTRLELFGCWLCDDLIGLKSFFDVIEAQAQKFPRLKVMRQLAHCHYHRIRGEYSQALAELEPALELAKPTRHIDWHYVATAHVELLTLLGRAEDALSNASEYSGICQREGMERARRGIERTTILALVAAGRSAEAQQRVERLIQEELADGVAGTILTLAYDAAARVAMAQKDADGFARWAGRVAEDCRRTDNPALKARYARLLRDASSIGMRTAGAGFSVVDHRPIVPSETTMDAVSSRLLTCTDTKSRAVSCLSLLLEETSSEEGFLFFPRDGGIEQVAALPPTDAPPELRGLVEAQLKAQVDPADETAVFATSMAKDALDELEGDDSVLPGEFDIHLLLAVRGSDLLAAGAAALRRSDGRRAALSTELLSRIATTLIENDDVEPVTCGD